MIQVRVFDIPAIFRWPKVDELWTVRRDGGMWVLDARIEHEQDDLGVIEDMAEGETKIAGDTTVKGTADIEGDTTVKGDLSVESTGDPDELTGLTPGGHIKAAQGFESKWIITEEGQDQGFGPAWGHKFLMRVDVEQDPGWAIEANARHRVDMDGYHNWGPGGFTKIANDGVDTWLGRWETEDVTGVLDMGPYVTTPWYTELPPNTEVVDGTEIVYLADETNGVAWRLKYLEGSTYPWYFIGGTALMASADPTTDPVIRTSSGTYDTLSNDVTLTLPLAGDYMWTYDREMYLNTSGTVYDWLQWYTTLAYNGVNDTSAGIYAVLETDPVSADYQGTWSVEHVNWRKTGLTAGTIVTTRHQVDKAGGAVGASDIDTGFGTLFFTPIRVG